MRALCIMAATLSACVLLSVPAFAEFEWGIGPAVVTGEDSGPSGEPGADGSTFGARAHLEWRGHRHDLTTAFPRSRDHRIKAVYLWVPEDFAITPQTELTLAFGTSVSLSRPNPPAPIDVSLDSLPPAEQFNYGLAGGRIHAQYEASANRTEQAVSGGIELFHALPNRDWWPSLLFTFDLVKPIESEIRESSGLEDETFQRFMARGYWLHSRWGFTGELDASWFRSWGLEAQLESVGWQSGGAVQATLGRSLDWRLIGPVTLATVYLQYAEGQMPTAPATANGWTLGIDLGTN